MSFFSYRTRIPRHFDSHANVLSTTHRRVLWPCDRSQPFFSSPIRRMCGVYPAASPPFPPLVVVRLIQGHVLRLILCRLWPLYHYTLDRRCQEPPFQHVLPGDHHPQRSTVAIGHHALFGALFSSVGGILARLSPQSGPCPASRRPAATPTAPRLVRHTRRPRPPRFARRSLLQPALESVVDSALRSVPLWQLVPLAVSAQRKMIAFRFFRQLATFRPVCFLGQNSKRIGSILR